eukprot:sb/3466758/
MGSLGLLGNGLVLYSSIRYNALKLDKISVMLVRNLAVADFIFALLVIVPWFMDSARGRYPSNGPVFCFITIAIGVLMSNVNVWTVWAISAYRFLILVNPFRVISSRSVYIFLASIWILPTLLGLATKEVFESHITMAPNQRIPVCGYSDDNTQATSSIQTMILLAVPMVMTLILNVAVLGIAMRARNQPPGGGGGFNYKGLVTVLSMSALLIVSWIPFTVLVTLFTVTNSVDGMWFHFGCLFMWLNTAGNPILYTLTNKRFSGYVRELCLGEKRMRSTEGVTSQTSKSTTELRSGVTSQTSKSTTDRSPVISAIMDWKLITKPF